MNKNSVSLFLFCYNISMEEKIAISACLLGVNCKYNTGNNYNSKLFDFIKDKRVFVICPEVFSGMPTPRIPSEILNDKVINASGTDVTLYFTKGREDTLRFLKESGVAKVILKDGSPSCGYTYIYDGTFTGKRIEGMGYTAKYLIENGIEVIYFNES